MPTPSRLALWLLRRVLPAERHETVSGDLEELLDDDRRLRGSPWRARFWYWRQVLSLVWWQLQRPSPLRPPIQSSHGDRMHGFTHDLRYALRGLLKAPAFSLVAIVTLALGIGANTAIFTLINALLLKPLPFEKPDELMLVHMLAPDRDGAPGSVREFPWSYPKYEVFRAEQRVFADHAVFNPREWTLTGAGDAERLRGEAIGARYLATLGVTPLLGRDFTPDEDHKPGIDAVVLLSHRLWQRRFGADPTIVGRVVHLNSRPYTVVGVLPEGFSGLGGNAQLWVPVMTLEPQSLAAKWNHWVYVVARRQQGVTAVQAQRAIELLGSRIDAVVGQPAGVAMPKIGATAAPLDAARVDPLIRRSTLVLFAAVVLVLLIGCVNLANLMASRADARQREVAIRLTVGATRGRLVRQLLLESLLLAGAGAVAGLAVAYAVLAGAAALLPDAGVVLPSRTFGLTRISVRMIEPDLTTLAFALVVAVITALLFGLLPAWRASRADIVDAMKAGAAGSISGGARSLAARRVLIVAETALALVLLVASGLMIQSVRNLRQTELGFVSEHLVTLGLQLAGPQYDGARPAQFFSQLLDRLRAIPGVQAAAYGSCAPVSGGCDLTPIRFPDRPPVFVGSGPPTGVIYASPDLFRALGIRLVSGRAFTPQDAAGQPSVVVVSETLARAHFGGASPLGRRIGLGVNDGFSHGAEIVGVVTDTRYVGVEAPPRADTYVPLLQAPQRSGLVFLRTTLAPSAIVPAIRREIAALDPNLPASELKTMDTRFEEATWQTRLSADLLTLFAGLALLLAAIGVYGVMAQTVQQRTREIGLRLALGADRRGIFALVMGRALASVSLGIVVGVALSVLSTRALESLLYEVRPHDPTTIVVLATGLLAVALVASYFPARRAMRVDPLTSLRAD